MKRENLLILFFICANVQIWSQEANLVFKAFGIEDGLSHRNVFHIEQDPAGFLWLATFKGLNRFDGRNFEKLHDISPTGILTNTYVPELLFTPDSMMYASVKNALLEIDLSSYKVSQISMKEALPIEQGDVIPLNLHAKPNSEIWMTGHWERQGKSNWLAIKDRKTILPLGLSEGEFPDRAIADIDGKIWTGDKYNGVYIRQAEGKIIDSIEFRSDIKNPPNARVAHIFEEDNGTIWVLLHNGQLYFKTSRQKSFKLHDITNKIYQTSDFQSLLVEENGNIWIGGIGALWRYDKSRNTSQNLNAEIKRLTENNCTVRQVYKDFSGVIWLSTDFGAIRITQNAKLFTNYLDQGNDNCSNGFCSMRGITADDEGNIYFSYYNSIHVLNGHTEELKPLFPGNNFFNFPFGLHHHQGHLYTGNGKKINLESLKIDTLLSVPSADKGYFCDGPDQSLFWAYGSMLYNYDPVKKNLEPIAKEMIADLQIKEINVLHFSKDKRTLWIGTNEKGAIAYDISKKTTRIIQQSGYPELLSNRILTFCEIGLDTLWLGSANGIYRYTDGSRRLKIYTKKNGMSNNFVNGILAESPEILWVSTDNGLNRIETDTDHIIHFHKEDGLTKNEFNRTSQYKAEDGRMYFGGLNGVVAFYPSEQFLDVRKSKDLPVLLSSFSKLDGKADSLITLKSGISGAKPVVLNHYDKFFSFEFALADFSNPVTHLYSYILEGYDKSWSTPQSIAYARYNNIPAGKYTFKVKSSAGQDIWNRQNLTLDIVVREAFYKKPWFYALVLSLGLLGILGYTRYRVYKSYQREKALEKLVNERTKALKEAQHRSENLLLNILPAEVAEELKIHGKAKARRHEKVTVLFADARNFSKIASQMEPERLVSELDFYFRAFDQIISAYGLEKIKTIGDAYMCVGGIPEGKSKSVANVVHAALEMQEFAKESMNERESKELPFFQWRIGIHCGPVVGGVVGSKKFAYDIWGDTVNIAARLESHGAPDKVNISKEVYKYIHPQFHCSKRGTVEVHNIGEVEMYFVDGSISTQSRPTLL